MSSMKESLLSGHQSNFSSTLWCQYLDLADLLDVLLPSSVTCLSTLFAVSNDAGTVYRLFLGAPGTEDVVCLQLACLK